MTKRCQSSKYSDEVASTGTLAAAGIGAAYMLPDSFFRSAVEAVKQGRHAGRTVGEMVVGNEGQNAVESLLEANLRSGEYYGEQVKLIDRLESTYVANETLGREAQRLGVQLKGMVSEVTAAGDSAANTFTFGAFRRIDDAIMNLVGSAKDARDGLPKLQEIARTAREFYDGREKLDKTIESLMGHLEKVGLGAVRDNEGIAGDINGMITQLDRTYKVEDKVFDIHDKVSFLKALMGKKREELTTRDIASGKEVVGKYTEQVGELRTSTEQHAPIGPYQDPTAGLTYAINPITLGLAGALAVKGATKLMPSFIERPVTKALAFPAYLARGAVRGGIYAGKLAASGFNKAYHGIMDRREAKGLKETTAIGENDDKSGNTA